MHPTVSELMTMYTYYARGEIELYGELMVLFWSIIVPILNLVLHFSGGNWGAPKT